jgi:hypothetical protein
MRERRAIALSVVCATIAGVLLVFSQLMAAQNATVSADRLHDRGRIYFPYPPGIIPYTVRLGFRSAEGPA